MSGRVPGRKIPTPFSRPSVSINKDEVKREWKWVKPSQLKPGDMTRLGVVISATTNVDTVNHVVTVILELGQPDPQIIKCNDAVDMLFAFTQ